MQTRALLHTGFANMGLSAAAPAASTAVDFGSFGLGGQSTPTVPAASAAPAASPFGKGLGFAAVSPPAPSLFGAQARQHCHCAGHVSPSEACRCSIHRTHYLDGLICLQARPALRRRAASARLLHSLRRRSAVAPLPHRRQQLPASSVQTLRSGRHPRRRPCSVSLPPSAVGLAAQRRQAGLEHLAARPGSGRQR